MRNPQPPLPWLLAGFREASFCPMGFGDLLVLAVFVTGSSFMGQIQFKEKEIIFSKFSSCPRLTESH